MAGWNRPNAANQPAVKKGGAKAPSKVKGIVAGLVTVCALGGLCLWLFSGGEDAPKAKAEKERGRIKQVKPATVARETEEKTREQKILKELDSKVREYVKKPLTNNVELVGLKPLDPSDPDNALRTKFAHDVANLLVIPPGMPVPKFLVFGFMIDGDFDATHGDGGNKQFLENMRKWRVTLKEGDNEESMTVKENLVKSQMEVLDSIEAGGTVNDAVRDAYKFRVEAAEIRSQLIGSIKELHAGDRDMKITRELVRQANEQLEEKGIVPISDDDIFEEDDFENEKAEKEGVSDEKISN